MRTRWGAVLLLAFSARAAGASAPARLLTFVVDNRLTMMIGEFAPGKGWVQSTDFYAPPDPGDRFTLYGPEGLLGEVTITELRRSGPDDTFADWSVLISSRDYRTTPFALAVSGQPALAGGALEPIPLDDPMYRGIMARYLKSKGLRVDQPFLTQAFKIPVSAQDSEETLLVAHSDADALTDEKEAAVYAVTLLCWKDHGKEKILPLASQTSFKPAGRRIEDHERLYGTRDFLRILSALDVDGDGWREIVLYRATDDATQIDVFTFNGRRLRRVLSAYKPNYN
jgi:hypothetical protein